MLQGAIERGAQYAPIQACRDVILLDAIHQ
jgi:hypothetical protein